VPVKLGQREEAVRARGRRLRGEVAEQFRAVVYAAVTVAV